MSFSNLFTYPQTVDVERDIFGTSPYYTGIYIDGGTGVHDIRENMNSLNNRANTFLTQHDNAVPYAYSDDERPYWPGVDRNTFLRTISLHHRYYQSFDPSSDYVNPRVYIEQPTAILYIARWMLLVAEVTNRNPLTLRVFRNRFGWQNYLSSDPISSLYYTRNYFRDTTQTHGFGNDRTNYTSDGVGIPCLFTGVNTARWSDELNSNDSNAIFKLFYLKVINANHIEIYRDSALTNGVDTTTWGNIDPSSDIFLLRGGPMGSDSVPMGQAVHFEILNGGTRTYEASTASGAKEFRVPIMQNYRSLAYGVDGQNRTGFRVSREYARILASKAAGASYSFTDDIDNNNRTDRGRYRPRISYDYSREHGWLLERDGLDEEFCGLFADCGVNYRNTQNTNTSYLDAHMITWRAQGGPATPVVSNGNIGLIDFTRSPASIAFTRPVSYEYDLSNSIVFAATQTQVGDLNLAKYVNGRPFALRMDSSNAQLGYLYDWDGSLNPRATNGVEGLHGFVRGGQWSFTDANIITPSMNFGSNIAPAVLDPDNTRQDQLYPNEIAPTSVEVDWNFQASVSVVSSGRKFRNTTGARNVRITYNYNNLEPDNLKRIQAFVQTVRGQYAAFSLQIYRFNRGGWGDFLKSNPDSVTYWNDKKVFLAKDSANPGDVHLPLIGFGSNEQVVRAGDVLMAGEGSTFGPSNRFMEISRDVYSNGLGEALIPLSSPLKTGFNVNDQVFLISNVEYVTVTLAENEFSYSTNSDRLSGLSVGFDLMV